MSRPIEALERWTRQTARRGNSPGHQAARRHYLAEVPGRDQDAGMGQACHVEEDIRPNLAHEAVAVACSRRDLAVGSPGACSDLVGHKASREGRSG